MARTRHKQKNKLRLRLILDVRYDTHGVSEEELRKNLGYIVRHAMGEGLFTNETEAEVDTCSHRIETVPHRNIQVSKALKSFFQVESRNEDDGGVRPATLGSAKESWTQAPDDVRASWCKISDESTLAAVEGELDSLIDRYGPDVQLATVVA